MWREAPPARWEGHRHEVLSVAFSPDGRKAVSASLGEIKAWDVATGRPAAAWPGHSDWVYQVAFSPDGRLLLSAGGDRMIRLWEASTYKPGVSWKAHEPEVLSAAFSPDGRAIVSGGQDNVVRVWRTADGKAITSWDLHKEKVRSVAFSPDGRYVLSGSYDHNVRLWNVGGQLDQEEIEIKSWKAHKDRVLAVAVFPDGGKVLSAGHSLDNSLKVWESSTGKSVAAWEGHQLGVFSAAVSPDGRRIVSAGGDGLVKFWDARGALLGTGTGHRSTVYAVAFSPDGRRALSGGADKTLRLWESPGGRQLATWSGHDARVMSVAFSPDGKFAISGSSSVIALWEVESGARLAVWGGHRGWVYSVAFSPDGRTALSGGGDMTLRLWDAATGRALGEWPGHQAEVLAAAFLPGGRFAVSGSGDRTVKLWDVAAGKALATWRWHDHRVMALAVSRDGRRAVSGSWDQTLMVWDLAKGLLQAHRRRTRAPSGPSQQGELAAESRAETHFRQGRRLVAKGAIGAAADSLRKAVAASPANAEYKNWLGSIHYDLGEHPEALGQFQVVLSQDPGKVWNYFLGMNLLKLGQLKAAQAALERALKDDSSKNRGIPREREAREMLAKLGGYRGHMGSAAVHEQAGRIKEAGAEMSAALALGARRRHLRRAPEPTPPATLPDGPVSGSLGVEPTPAAPLVLAGKYELGRRIGEGGMGVVFEALDRKLDRKVAVKRLHAELRRHQVQRERFLREAQIIAHLSHPFIVGIFDVLAEGEETYIVLEYVLGEPLSSILGSRERLTLKECQSIFTNVCHAMDYAHKKHVLHRDLKPSNIMIDASGFAKVMDFGLAREAKDTISRLSRVEVSGTPAYMAPEQHLGEAHRASDVYSLGVCLYESLTGSLPFPGPDFLVQKERNRYDPPSRRVPGLPAGIDELLAAVLTPDPVRRLSDPMALQASLSKC